MNIYKPRRGVPGELTCVCCFEESCFGCACTSPPVGTCPVCGQDVRLDDDYDWRDGDPVHKECLEEKEDENEYGE